MSLADYLAKNYLNADPAPSQSSRPKKKRKKEKHATVPDGLIIADDDPPSLRNSISQVGLDDDDDGPLTVGSHGLSEFRKSKKSSWKTVGEPAPRDSDQAAADAILASAAKENDAWRDANAAEDAPAVVDGAGAEDNGDDDGPRMESGARAGLQTAEQTAAMVKAQERKKARDAAAFSAAAGGAAQETIYRDASGRIINVAMKRAEARREQEEEARKAEQAKEALKGDVQRREQQRRRQELEEAKYMPLARTVDDNVMNEELRSKERWNDPAAQFLSSSTSGAGSKSGRPVYKGAAPPNRYGIRPGYRWDGVDRSNGFEQEWFAARNRKERIGQLEYQWQMDE